MIKYNIDSKIKTKSISDIIDLPHTIRVVKFDEESVGKFKLDFGKAINSGQDIIPIVIDSYGGQVYSLLSMIGIIKSSPLPIATIIQGKAMSCGAVLFTCGAEGFRYMDPLSTLMIHDVSSMSWGKVEEIKADAKETERLNKLIYTLMAKNVGKPDNYFLDIVHTKGHADWFLTAEEAKEHNLTNHIKLPKYSLDIKVSSTFE